MAQVVLAASVAMAGAILILVFGNQFLDWRWLALLAAVTFPLAYYRTARRVPTPYRVAQIVDERLALRDSLSTALYFSDTPGALHVTESIRLAQLAESARIGRDVDPAAAIPLAAPRTALLFGALFMAAAALFALRYGIERRIDLRKPLVSILYDVFGGGFDQRAAAHPKKGGKRPWDQSPASISVDDHNPAAEEKLNEAPDSVINTVDDVNPDNTGAQQPGGNAKGKSDGKQAEGERAEEGAEQSETAEGSSTSKDADQAGAKQGDSSSGKQSPNSNGDNSSLASKIKDAMQNLMASMRPQNKGANQQQQGGQNSGQDKAQQAKAGQKGAAGKGEKKSGEQSSESQEGNSDDDSDSGKSADGKSSGKSSDQQGNHNPGSGIGKQDGAKDARLAEQLAAMGKISEIIGKRSANVSGEVTVEVNSSKQQIRTQYSESKASHGEAGGEINRDEVPPALQQYVQQYFEQVRKQAAPAKGAGKTAPPQPQASAPAPPGPPAQ
jgi:hypothetical protein